MWTYLMKLVFWALCFFVVFVAGRVGGRSGILILGVTVSIAAYALILDVRYRVLLEKARDYYLSILTGE